jgi:hypothetical protein
MVALALAVVTSFPYDNYSASVAAAFFVYLFYFFTLITSLNVNFRNYTVLALIRLRVAMASISTANYWLYSTSKDGDYEQLCRTVRRTVPLLKMIVRSYSYSCYKVCLHIGR